MDSYSWHTPEYVHKKKTADWYWTVGIITAALALTSIIFGNFLFAIVLLIGAFSLALFAARKPHTIQVEVNNKGVRVDKTVYPYATVESFGIDSEHESGPRLYLKSKKLVMPLIMIPIAIEDIDGLRVLLARHLKEEMFEENLLHTIFERMGF